MQGFKKNITQYELKETLNTLYAYDYLIRYTYKKIAKIMVCVRALGCSVL